MNHTTRSDPIESAKSHFFDTSGWAKFCDVTLTLKQAWQPDRGGWVKIDDYRCRQAFRHFMNLLNGAVGMATRVRQPSMATNPFSTRHQRFACARLSQPCLTGSRPAVSATLTTIAFDNSSLRRLEIST